MSEAKQATRTAQKSGARIEEHALDNGLTVLLAERRGDPVVTVMVWYKVGSKNEREHEAGVSHFLEHMMFKGSSNFAKGEVDRVTTELGGQNNAFTSQDHTAYWFELASDRWEKALEIEADRMSTLALDPREFDAERAVVLEELAMGQDDPWRVLSERVQTALLPRHPYRRPVIGYADALSALKVEDMREYWRRFYRPENATLVVCGDIEPHAALALIEKHFARIPRGAAPAADTNFRSKEPRPPGEQRLEMRWDDQGKRLCIAWETAAFATDDDYALDVLSTLLSGGRLSRLYRRLVLEQELATSISTSNDTRVEGGVFWLFAECAADADPAELERAVDAELARLRDEPVGRRELDRVRSMLEASEAHDVETASDLAEELGEHAVDAHWQLALEGLARLKRVGSAEVRAAARKYLTPERRIVGWCTPKTARRATARRARAVPGKKQ